MWKNAVATTGSALASSEPVLQKTIAVGKTQGLLTEVLTKITQQADVQVTVVGEDLLGQQISVSPSEGMVKAVLDQIATLAGGEWFSRGGHVVLRERCRIDTLPEWFRVPLENRQAKIERVAHFLSSLGEAQYGLLAKGEKLTFDQLTGASLSALEDLAPDLFRGNENFKVAFQDPSSESFVQAFFYPVVYIYPAEEQPPLCIKFCPEMEEKPVAMMAPESYRPRRGEVLERLGQYPTWSTSTSAHVPPHQILTLEEVVSAIRKDIGERVYVDRSVGDLKLWTTSAEGSIAEVLTKIAWGAHLEVRTLGDLLFLGPDRSGRGVGVLHQQMDEQILQLIKDLVPGLWDWHIDLPVRSFPFKRGDFLEGKAFPYSELGPLQQGFITTTLRGRLPDAIDQATVQLMPGLCLDVTGMNPQGKLTRQDRDGATKEITLPSVTRFPFILF